MKLTRSSAVGCPGFAPWQVHTAATALPAVAPSNVSESAAARKNDRPQGLFPTLAPSELACLVLGAVSWLIRTVVSKRE
jgi:hypothetical protein